MSAEAREGTSSGFVRIASRSFSHIIFALVICAAVGTKASAPASGPKGVALGDRGWWPEELSSVAAFDRSSRAEILSFTAALAETDALDEPVLSKALGVIGINTDSVRRWRHETERRLLQNFLRASEGCSAGEPFCGTAGSATELRALAIALDGSLPGSYRQWRDEAREFHRIYAGEQLRLAALFPSPTSEILTVSEYERPGFDLADREFLLTFDDGPTSPGGATDTTLAMLHDAEINGIFFLLGERLQARQLIESSREMHRAYAGMCVASHGWSHVSHSRLPEWWQSVDKTATLLRETFGPRYRPLFRPPYGQRSLDSGSVFAARRLAVVLWNIDSQDWNPKIAAGDVGPRVLSLMLLWRRGIILFHDVHDRAVAAVPFLLARTRNAGVTWTDCRRYPA